MNLHRYRVLFLTVVGIVALLVASPILSRPLILPTTEFFTEFWILDSNHRAKDYPFNVFRNRNYSVFLEIANHLGYCAYYVIEVKFRNQTQPLPNPAASEPSSLPPLFEYRFFVVDGGIQEAPLTFRILEVSSYADSMLVGSVSINDVVFPVNSFARWSSEYKGFRYQLLFELWLYNTTAQSLQFHNRFVGIWLNITS